MSLFDEIKKFDLREVFQLNAKSIIQDSMIDGMPYVIIDNVLKNPDALLDFLKCFPADSYTTDCHKVYEEGVRDVKGLENPYLYQRPAGLQQRILSEILVDISFNYYKFLVEQDFIPPHEAMYDDNFNPTYVVNELSGFQHNTQLHYPNMLSIGGNNTPTVDRYEYMFKLFLTDGVDNGNINFYKIKYKNRYFSDINEIMNTANDEEKQELSQILNGATTGTEIKPYNLRVDENVFEKYHTIEYKFNRLVLHPGSYFYGVDYNAVTEKNCRYILESGYSDFSKLNSPKE